MKIKQKLSKDIEKILIITLLIIIPLYPKFPLVSVPGTYVAMRIEDLVIVAMCVYLLIRYVKDLKTIISMPISKAFMVYFAISAVSLIYSITITNTTHPLLGTLHLVRRIQYIAPFYLGYLALKNNSINKTFIFKTLTMVISLILIYGLGQKYLEWPIIITQNSEYAKGIALRSIPGGHLNSTFAGHYDLASYMILIIPMFIVYFAKIVDLKKITKEQLIILTTLIFGTWLIGISGSRISTVSFMGAGVIALIIIRKLRLIPFFLISSIVIFSFSSSLIARYQRLIEVGGERLETVINGVTFDLNSNFIVNASDNIDQFPQRRETAAPTPTPVPVLEDRSTSIRLNVEWPRALRAFNKNPILGTGFSSITLATDNDYLRLLGELGILGFLSFASIFIVIFTKLLSAIKNINTFNRFDSSIVVGFTSALFGIFLNATFIDIFEASKFAITFWLFAGIVINIVEKNVENTKT